MHPEVSCQLCLSYFHTQILDKASWLLLIFICVQREHAPFNSKGYTIPGSLHGFYVVFNRSKPITAHTVEPLYYGHFGTQNFWPFFAVI